MLKPLKRALGAIATPAVERIGRSTMAVAVSLPDTPTDWLGTAPSYVSGGDGCFVFFYNGYRALRRHVQHLRGAVRAVGALATGCFDLSIS